MPPLGKDFHQPQNEMQTSCLICYNHYESYTDGQEAGERLRGPPALIPDQPLLSGCQIQGTLRGGGGGGGP